MQMSRNVLILKGSPRKNGNSATLADQTALGAGENGAQVEVVSLDEMRIAPCDACDFCAETDGVCVIQDDMQTLYPKIQQADAIVIASPIYWFTFSAQTKLCIDRWYAFQPIRKQVWPDKQIGIILTYGDSDTYDSGAVNAIHTYQSMFRYLGVEIAGMVYGSAHEIGDVQKQPDLMQKAYALGEKLAVVNSG
jgi:multimeric flavodoxin WrbA